MASNVKIPQVPNDPAIKQGDQGPGVEQVQSYLQENYPRVKNEQELEASVSGNKQWSFYDSGIKGIFEKQTSYYLVQWQAENKGKIKKAGNLDDSGYDREKGIVGYATAVAMGLSSQQVIQKVEAENTQQVEQKTEPITQEVLPASNEEYTHIVQTQDPGHRLACRKNVSFVKVSLEANEDVADKGALVMMLPIGTKIKMIEPYLGYQCQWCQMEVIETDPIYSPALEYQKNNKLYCHMNFLRALPGAPEFLPIRCMDCSRFSINDTVNRNYPFPDWTILDECEPFFDTDTCSYYITFISDFTETNEAVFDTQKDVALRQGIDLLLDFYDKQRVEGDIDRYLNAFEFASIPEGGWVLDERPGSTMKFLIRIIGKYFEAIPRTTDYLTDIPNIDENGELPEGWKTISFFSSRIEDNIETIAKRFEDYIIDLKRQGNLVRGLDFKEEAEKLRNFIVRLKKLLKDNGYSLRKDHDDIIEIGFKGECFETIYVLLNQGEFSFPLRIGIDCFLYREPVNLSRTMGYVFYVNEMVEDITREKRHWLEFIQDYSCPLYEIRPSDPIREDIVLEDFEPEKTTTELEQEDKVVRDPEIKKKKYEERKFEFDYVGDEFLNCENILYLADKIKDLNSAYSEVLNKTDISNLVSFVISCIANKLSIPDLTAIICRKIFEALPQTSLEKILDILPSDQFIKVTQRIAEYNNDPLGAHTANNLEVIKNALRTATDEGELCKAIREFDPRLFQDMMKRLGSFLTNLVPALPKPFTIDIPDDLTIENIMGYIAAEIERAIIEAISSFLLGMLKQILQSLCDVCNPNNFPPKEEEFGEENINDILKNRNKINDKLFNNLNIPIDILGDSGLQDFLNDLSSILLPSEICKLINGVASESTYKIIINFVRLRYKNLLPYFNTYKKIKDFFLELGKYVDKSVCEQIGSIVADSKYDNCDFNTQRVRKNLLEDKMSQKQMDEQIKFQNERNKERISNMLDLLDPNILNNIIPPISNGCNSKTNNRNSIVPNDPPSMDFLNEKVINSMFGSVEGAFNNDMEGYIFSLVEQRFEDDNVKSSEYKKSNNARNKQLDESGYSAEEQEILLNDPFAIGAGRGRNLTLVAPEVKNNLSNILNFKSKEEDDPGAIFIFETSSNKEKKIQELTKQLIENIKKSKTAFPNNKLIDTEDRLLIEQDKIEQEKQACEKMGGIYTPEKTSNTRNYKMGENSSVEYELPKFEGAKNSLRDIYYLTIKDNSFNKLIEIAEDSELDPDTLSLLIERTNLNPAGYDSAQQEIFGDFVTNLYQKIFDKESQNKISNKNSIFKNYFKNDVFNAINIDIIRFISLEIANSKMFNLDELKKIRTLDQGQTDSGLSHCAPRESSFSLLDFKNIKKSTKENYDKNVSNCSKNLNKEELGVGGNMEESIVSGAVKILVRVYVAEQLLKGIFAFSRFDVNTLLNDTTIVKYIFKKIKNELKDEGDNFYNGLSLKAKSILLNSGSKLVDPYAEILDEKELVDRDLNNKLSPKYQSGEAFLDYMIKSEMKNISDLVNEFLNSDKKNAIKLYFDKKQIVSVPKRLSQYPNSFLIDRFGVGKANDYNTIDYSGYVLSDYNLLLEKYVKVDAGGGKPERVVTKAEYENFFTNEFSQESECGRYCLRLTLLPPVGVETRFSKEMKKLFLKDSSINDQYRAYFLDGGRSFPIPIVEVESENTFTNAREIKKISEKDEIEKLKNKLFEQDDFKILFNYIFSFKRLISIMSIYSMESFSSSILNSDYLFYGTKKSLKDLIRSLEENNNDWWKNEDQDYLSKGGNVGIRNEMMKNATTSGCRPDLAKMAAMTIPIMIKGLAERYDPCYGLMKKLFDLGVIDNLGWQQVFKVLPVNIFFPFGYGPPLTNLGMFALGVDLLPGEEKEKKKREEEYKNEEGKDKCDDKIK